LRQVIVLSGPIGVGKSAFAKALAQRYPIQKVSTRAYIIKVRGTSDERRALQDAGDTLDLETNGAWVADAAEEASADSPESAILLIDSARIGAQVSRLKERFGTAAVYHVHLTAPDEVLEGRYLARPAEMKEFSTYAEVRQSGTEAAIEDLAEIADIVVEASKSSPDSLVTYAMAGRLPVLPGEVRLVDVIVGGQYGSEGKGNICAFLAKEYDVLMRIGGPNAGHKVADPKYTYVQLPSGTGANPNAHIIIGAGSTIWLPKLLQEISDHPHLSSANLSIDEQAMIIEEEDRQAESQTLESIASTKQGVGAATARKILGRGDKSLFGPAVRLARDVEELGPYRRDTKAELHKAYEAGKRIMLEGTQGTGLSIHHGQYPKVTSRETSAAGCLGCWYCPHEGTKDHYGNADVSHTRGWSIRRDGGRNRPSNYCSSVGNKP
jgi:adenylosuccinate synthase